QAEALYGVLAEEKDNPALALGVALGAAAVNEGRDKVALVDDGTGITGLGDWAEQLIAESTGKNGRGILPVVVENPAAAGALGDDVLTVTTGGSLGPDGGPGGGRALAVMTYLDRIADADAARIRPALARASRGRAVTFGWGPRFLHSTGQYHKGGPQVGSYLQITGAVGTDLPVPGQPFSFGTLQAAQ